MKLPLWVSRLILDSVGEELAARASRPLSEQIQKSGELRNLLLEAACFDGFTVSVDLVPGQILEDTVGLTEPASAHVEPVRKMSIYSGPAPKGSLGRAATK